MYQQTYDLVRNNCKTSLAVALCLANAAFLISGLTGDVQWSPALLNTDLSGSNREVSLTGLGVAHIVGWTLLPPVWFFLETFIVQSKLLPSERHSTESALKASYDRFLLAQDLAAKVWAATLAAILFLCPK